MLYYCVAIKVTLKYLKTNREKKEMFTKELKQHTTLAFRVKAIGCNAGMFIIFSRIVDREAKNHKNKREKRA